MTGVLDSTAESIPDDHDLFTAGPMRTYLVSRGLIERSDTITLRTLSGGVSNHTALIEVTGRGSMVIKKARPRLDVDSDWRSDPRRALIEARALHWLPEFLPPGNSCPLYWVDEDEMMFAGAAVPSPHRIWKDDLLSGVIERGHFVQFAEMLGGLHVRSSRSPIALKAFEDRTFFETLRIDPFYRSAATALPAASRFLTDLAERTRQVQRCLVHGDATPKNLLIHNDDIVLIDHEVIHTGDPCFDVGLALAHFISKAVHLRSQSEILAATTDFVSAYAGVVGDNADYEWGTVERQRAGEHALGCVFARVVGKSPLPYLSEAERVVQLDAAMTVLQASVDLEVHSVPERLLDAVERLEEQGV